MECLSCNAAMKPLEWKDVVADSCPDCGGLWVEEGELELLLGSGEAARHYLHSLDPGTQNKAKLKNCPHCKKALEKVVCGKGRIPMDKCVEDHGLWCEGGSLEALLEFADAGNPKVLQFLKGLLKKK